MTFYLISRGNNLYNQFLVHFLINRYSTLWVNPLPLRPAIFWHFSQTVENFKSILHTYYTYVHIYARLQIFIQLSQTLTKLCHIYISSTTYSSHNMLKMSSIGRNARVQTFAKVVDSLLIVVRDISSQICCFYNVNKHARYDMTSSLTSFAQ